MPPDEQPDTVTVPEVRSVEVSPRRALRLFIGRFIVDYIETFTGLVGVQLALLMVSPPLSADGWKLIVVQFAGPGLSALLSSLRRAWPTIKKWLAPPTE